MGKVFLALFTFWSLWQLVKWSFYTVKGIFNLFIKE